MEVRLTKYEEKLAQRGKEGNKAAFESMLGRFNRLVQASGLFRELKRREFYEKPSAKRRRKLHEARLRRLRKERKGAIRKPRATKSRRQRNKRFNRETKNIRRDTD